MNERTALAGNKKAYTMKYHLFESYIHRPAELSTHTEINGGSIEQPPVVGPVGNATTGVLKPGESIGALTADELTTSELETNAPAIPRADAVDGLARGAVTDAAETTVIEIPRLARALRHRDFRLFWTGNFLSNIGTWMQNIAQGWLVLQLTNSDRKSVV